MPSAGRLSVEEQGQQSVSVIAVTFSNLPPLRRRSSRLMAADRVSTGRDRTTNCTQCTVDDSHYRLFGRTRSGGLWRNATPVTHSSLRPTYWTLPATDGRPAQHVLEFPSVAK